MSNSINKRRAKMHEAKKALKTLQQYSQNVDDPIKLAELLELLLKQIHIHANVNDPSPMRSVYAFAKLNADLNSRAVKVKYAQKLNVPKMERNNFIMRLHKQKKSYQEIAERCEAMGVQITKSAVWKIVKKMEAEKDGI